jgi:hypothetical protein
MDQENREIFKADVPPPGAGELEYFYFFAQLKRNNSEGKILDKGQNFYFTQNRFLLFYYYRSSILIYFFLHDLKKINRPLFSRMTEDLQFKTDNLIAYVNSILYFSDDSAKFTPKPIPGLVITYISFYLGFDSVTHFLRVLDQLYMNIPERVVLKKEKRGHSKTFLSMRQGPGTHPEKVEGSENSPL